MSFRLWLESKKTDEIFVALRQNPSLEALGILADSIEEDGNPNTPILRDMTLFDKKFINWYGKHTFYRLDTGDHRQLTFAETQRLKRYMPIIRSHIFEGIRYDDPEPHRMVDYGYFWQFIEKLAKGEKV